MRTRILVMIGVLVPTVGIIIGLSFIFTDLSSHHTVPANDKYCTSELIVKTTEYMGTQSDRKLMERIVRDEIAKFGAIYDITERKVSITDLGENNLRISLDGSWLLKSGRPDLVQALTELDNVEHVVNNRGLNLVVVCQ